MTLTFTAEKPANRWQRCARSTPMLPPATLLLPPHHVPHNHENRMEGRQMSYHQKTAPPQSSCRKDVTPHQHRSGTRPVRPCPVPACSEQPRTSAYNPKADPAEQANWQVLETLRTGRWMSADPVYAWICSWNWLRFHSG
jgi:hypothetical protein